MIFSLDKSIIDKNCIVIEIKDISNIKKRLNDLGINNGISIKKVLESPFGGICAYYILGTTIAIRNKDAKEILVSYE